MLWLLDRSLNTLATVSKAVCIDGHELVLQLTSVQAWAIQAFPPLRLPLVLTVSNQFCLWQTLFYYGTAVPS